MGVIYDDGETLHINKRPASISSRYKITEAIQVVGIYSDNKVRVLKNRNNRLCGELSEKEAVQFLSRMIASVHFEGSMEMFQETIAARITEKINEVLDGSDIIPKGEIFNEE
jgi:hypothetical protein